MGYIPYILISDGFLIPTHSQPFIPGRMELFILKERMNSLACLAEQGHILNMSLMGGAATTVKITTYHRKAKQKMKNIT